ncbi:MAG TPA: hypothetical protein VMY42_27935 [Thermoguttaceae bacterium]|nr:hypothetical protein [Thermoguttaceae bacterium]
MPSDAAQLATIKTQILAILVDITENPKPSYMIDGQSLQWAAYQRLLLEQIDRINRQIAAETPFEISSRGYT